MLMQKMITSIFSLPDIVLLEIFQYLSSEDVLYAFADSENIRLANLLREHGSFQQICLSSELSRSQYVFLSHGIWHYESVRSFVCKEIFCDFIAFLTPCRMFPSLVDLRIQFIRGYHDSLQNFVLLHASTLTLLSVEVSEQASIVKGYRPLFRRVLPHLNRLKLLDTYWQSNATV